MFATQLAVVDSEVCAEQRRRSCVDVNVIGVRALIETPTRNLLVYERGAIALQPAPRDESGHVVLSTLPANAVICDTTVCAIDKNRLQEVAIQSALHTCEQQVTDRGGFRRIAELLLHHTRAIP